MKLVITLTKEVPDQATAEALTATVRQKLSDHPDVDIKAVARHKITPEP